MPSRTADFTDFKVSGLSLAVLGRTEITLAEHEMPGPMSIRREAVATQPPAGARITVSLHVTVRTAVRIETPVLCAPLGVGVSARPLHRLVNLTFVEAARRINPIVAGRTQYYGRLYRSALQPDRAEGAAGVAEAADTGAVPGRSA